MPLNRVLKRSRIIFFLIGITSCVGFIKTTNQPKKELYFSLIQNEVVNRSEIKEFYVCKSTSNDNVDFFDVKVAHDSLLEKSYVSAGTDFTKNNKTKNNLQKLLGNKYSFIDESFTTQTEKAVVKLSNIGFSSDKKYGLIYIEIISKKLEGYGAFLFFKINADYSCEVLKRKFKWVS